jgi:hypothetical protein
MIRELAGALFALVGLAVIVTVFVFVGWLALLWLGGTLLVAAGVGLMIHQADVTEGIEDPSGEGVDAPR